MEDIFDFSQRLSENFSLIELNATASSSAEVELVENAWKCFQNFSNDESSFLACNDSWNISNHNISNTLFDGGEFQQQGALWIRLMVLLLYGIVCIVGLCGNSLVIYVVVCFSKMQTVTNLYIVNLAIADEFFLIGIPFLMSTTALQYWPFGNVMCKIYFTSTSVNQITSSMFLLVMSADRFLAVCHPISATKWRTPLIASIVAVTAWAISFIIMVPILMYAKTQVVLGTTTCNIFWPDGWISGDATIIIYSFVLGFAMPLILISIFYFLVIIRLRHVGPKRRSIVPPPASVSGGTAAAKRASVIPTTNNSSDLNSTPLAANAKRARDRKKSKRKVTKLVLTVITVYFLCWAPYWISQLALISMKEETYHSPGLLTIFLLAGCLSYSNSAMNPILYAFLSDNFKKSFLKACSCANRKDLNVGLTMDNSMFPRSRNGRRATLETGSSNQREITRPVPTSRFLVSNNAGDKTHYFNKPSIKISNEEEEGGFLEADDDGTAMLGNRRLSVPGQMMTTRTVAVPKIQIAIEGEGVHVTAL